MKQKDLILGFCNFLTFHILAKSDSVEDVNVQEVACMYQWHLRWFPKVPQKKKLCKQSIFSPWWFINGVKMHDIGWKHQSQENKLSIVYGTCKTRHMATFRASCTSCMYIYVTLQMKTRFCPNLNVLAMTAISTGRTDTSNLTWAKINVLVCYTNWCKSRESHDTLIVFGGCKFCFILSVVTPLAIYSREMETPEMPQFTL